MRLTTMSRRLPTPAAAQRVREATLTKLLTQHRIRRVDAAMLRGRLRTPAIKVAPGAAEAAMAHVRLVAERLALINQQLEHARRQLDRLVRHLTDAAAADAATASVEAEPASSNTPADATILLSLPGIGTGVLATLLAEGSDALRRRDYHALRCLCGVAPVTRRSGKSLLVVRRLAAHDRLRDWARLRVHRDGRVQTEPLAPLPNRLVGDRHASLREEIFSIAEAEAESIVEPNRVADDVRWESTSVIAGRLAPHRPTLPLVAST